VGSAWRRGKPGLPPSKTLATVAGGTLRRSSSWATHLSAMLQSGWGNRCGMRSRCSQIW